MDILGNRYPSWISLPWLWPDGMTRFPKRIVKGLVALWTWPPPPPWHPSYHQCLPYHLQSAHYLPFKKYALAKSFYLFTFSLTGFYFVFSGPSDLRRIWQRNRHTYSLPDCVRTVNTCITICQRTSIKGKNRREEGWGPEAKKGSGNSNNRHHFVSGTWCLRLSTLPRFTHVIQQPWMLGRVLTWENGDWEKVLGYQLVPWSARIAL